MVAKVHSSSLLQLIESQLANFAAAERKVAPLRIGASGAADGVSPGSEGDGNRLSVICHVAEFYVCSAPGAALCPTRL